MTPACPRTGASRPGSRSSIAARWAKTANCQVIVSVNAATDRASCPLGWRLFVPEAWDQDEQRRAKAKIPDDVRHAPKWQLALGIVDELIAWGLGARVVQADGGYGDITAFRIGLEERALSYVVQVKGTTSAQPADTAPVAPAYQGRGRPPVARYPDKPVSLRALALTAGQAGTHAIGCARATADRSRAASSHAESGPPTTPTPSRRRSPTALAARRMARRQRRARQVLALTPPRRHADRGPRAGRQAALVHRARLPRAQAMPRPRSLRRPQLPRPAPPPDLRHRRARLPDHHAPTPRPRPPSDGGSPISLYQAQRDLQTAPACRHRHCPTCQRSLPP
jgi:hypothetical protein